MFLIKTRLLENQHGIGVYSEEFIKRNSIVCQFLPGIDSILKEEDILNAPETVQEWLCDRAWKCKYTGKYKLSVDNACFINHSEYPNIVTWIQIVGTDYVIASKAIRDIKVGQEILANYNDIEEYPDNLNILFKLCLKFNKDIGYRKP